MYFYKEVNLVSLKVVLFNSVCAPELLEKLLINTDRYLNPTPDSDSFGLNKA